MSTWRISGVATGRGTCPRYFVLTPYLERCKFDEKIHALPPDPYIDSRFAGAVLTQKFWRGLVPSRLRPAVHRERALKETGEPEQQPEGPGPPGPSVEPRLALRAGHGAPPPTSKSWLRHSGVYFQNSPDM
jgi:hypothetical protein